MRLDLLYRQTVQRFLQVGIEDAEIDVLQLFEFCLGITRNQLFLYPERKIDDRQLGELEEVLARRIAREPLNYITGSREFWSLDFTVSPDVLIPRPETEFLIDQVLVRMNDSGFNNGPVLDMCTGSAVIAVILALELGSRHVVAVDRSLPALEVARLNIERHRCTESITLVCSDFFEGLRQDCRFELIVANPPYIALDAFTSLQPEVRDWEPIAALLAGEKGLDVIQRLAREGHHYLVPRGWIFCEIGADQMEEVYILFAEELSGIYEEVEVISDWAGRPRVLQARKREIIHG